MILCNSLAVYYNSLNIKVLLLIFIDYMRAALRIVSFCGALAGAKGCSFDKHASPEQQKMPGLKFSYPCSKSKINHLSLGISFVL